MYTEEDLAAANEMYQRIENTTRKVMLSYIYSSPRTYTDLITFTQLKPGSLYHHLKILNGLVAKQDHGLYSITETGKKVVESLELIQDKRPEVSGEHEADKEPDRLERIDQLLWLGSPNIVIISVLLVVTILLGLQNIAIAGSAIYSVSNSALLFDGVALVIGWFALYLLEQLFFSTKPYRSALYALVIRITMMLPAVVVGIGLVLIYITGGTVSLSGFQVLFAISIGLGYLVAVNGIQYLRGTDRKTAVNLALIPSTIDLLLGLVILVSA